VLHKVLHLPYVVVHEKWEVHHPHPGEMHEKPDVICIEAGKPSLTTEIFHDQSCEWAILIPQKPKWKDSSELAQTTVLDVRLIVMPLHLLLLMPLFPNVLYPCCH